MLSALFAVLVRKLVYSPISYDEEYFLWNGWSVLRGGVPYRDFAEAKPPMIFFANAAALAVGGLTEQRFRWVFAAFAFVGVIAVLVSALRAGGRALVVTPLVAGVTAAFLQQTFHDSSLDESEVIGTTFMFLAFAAMLGRETRLRLWLGGALFGLAVLSKEPFLFGVLGAMLTFFLRGNVDRARARCFFGWVVLGGATVGVSMFVFLIAAGSLERYIVTLRMYALLASDYAYEIGRMQRGTFWSEATQTFTYLQNGLVTLPILGVVAPIVVCMALAWRGNARAFAAAVAAFAGGVYAVTLGHCFWNHYFVMVVPGLMLMALVAAIAVSKRFETARPRARHALAVVVAVLALAPRSEEIAAQASTTFAPWGPPYGPELVSLIQSTTSVDDTILTLGPPGMYVFADRQGALPFNTFVDEVLNVEPGATDDEKLAELRTILAQKMPKMIFTSSPIGPRANRYLNGLFLPHIQRFEYRELSPNTYVLDAQLPTLRAGKGSVP
ncbi:MAG: hypothetical protein IT381_00600 [Deltaproteobacteria bacterium]|nr:hypothetical protein [Deltaproteobacteria bacterium]